MLRIKFYQLGPKISALSSIIKILVFWHRKMAKLFKPLNPYKMKTINIFIIGNDFSRRFRRCRIRICNNLKITNMKGGAPSLHFGDIYIFISNSFYLSRKLSISVEISPNIKCLESHFTYSGGLKFDEVIRT